MDLLRQKEYNTPGPRGITRTLHTEINFVNQEPNPLLDINAHCFQTATYSTQHPFICSALFTCTNISLRVKFTWSPCSLSFHVLNHVISHFFRYANRPSSLLPPHWLYPDLPQEEGGAWNLLNYTSSKVPLVPACESNCPCKHGKPVADGGDITADEHQVNVGSEGDSVISEDWITFPVRPGSECSDSLGWNTYNKKVKTILMSYTV